MDVVHYSEGILSAMYCDYFVLVKMLLCHQYPMLNGFSSRAAKSPDLSGDLPEIYQNKPFFYAYFSIFICRRTVLPAVSHLRYTESA